MAIDARTAGVRVRNRFNPSKARLTTGKVRFSAGRDVAAVQLSNDETTYIPVDHLEAAPECESRAEAFAAARTGGPAELARLLLSEKVSGDLTNIYFPWEPATLTFIRINSDPYSSLLKPLAAVY